MKNIVIAGLVAALLVGCATVKETVDQANFTHYDDANFENAVERQVESGVISIAACLITRMC